MTKYKEDKKRWKCTFFVTIVVIICSIGGLGYLANKPIVLEFGMFVGSNWDVANANSYQIIDKVIAEFEREHPRR